MRGNSRPATMATAVLAAGIGAYVVLQSYALVATASTQTDALVRTAWFAVVLAGGIAGAAYLIDRCASVDRIREQGVQ